jgi:hypothetical protein
MGALGPEGFPTGVANATWWARDAGNEADVITNVGGGTVTFSYERGPGATTLGALVAIGFSGDTPVAAGWKTNLDVPIDFIARYTIDLVPTGNTLDVHLWPATTAPLAACVYVDDATQQAAPMIVTAGDPDCDGFPTGAATECVPDIYLSKRGPDLAHTNCATDVAVMPPESYCVLGGPACVDGAGYQPTDRGCAPSTYCVPRANCDQCDNLGGTTRFGCLTHYTQFATSGTFLKCTVQIDTANGQICTDTLTAYDPNALPDLGPVQCVGNVSITDGTAWSDRVVLGSNAQFRVRNIDGDCNFEIEPSGTFGPANIVSAMIAIAFDNGHGLAVPIVFHGVDGACGAPQPCTLSVMSFDPEVASCVTAPFPPLP